MESTVRPRLIEVCEETFRYLGSIRAGDQGRDVDEVRVRMAGILWSQRRLAARWPELADLYGRADYLLRVTVDDVIIGSDWPHLADWRPLEKEAYGTVEGDERFFELLEDPAFADTELQEIFYACLGVGFTGRYFDDRDRVVMIRRALFRRLAEAARDSAPHPGLGERSIRWEHVLRRSLMLASGAMAVLIIARLLAG